MTAKSYNHKVVEPKWQKRWEEEGVNWPDEMRQAKSTFYNLWMFPYPSAEGLHAGHAFASTGSDIYGRFMRMNQAAVFQPIGYDSFGIHSENFAIKIGEHPQEMLDRTTQTYANQLKSLGHGYDWTRTVTTSDMDYYRWTQWLFVEMFKAGLAYRKTATVNWCPSCKTVLADEQVMTPKQAGKEPKDKKGRPVQNLDDVLVCERCGTIVEKKDLKQWFFRITDYADKLLENLDKLEWPDSIKLAQNNWIGKKQGVNITYPIKDSEKTVKVWTSRPDTNFGATFVVVSPEYAQKNLEKDLPDSYANDVNSYINRSLKRNREERVRHEKEKTGVFTGLYAVNQLNDYEMPIWVADFVLTDVGTGAVVGVPGHDLRDFEFAQAHDLPIKRVVVANDGDESEITEHQQVQEEEGTMINSEFLNGLHIHEATQKMMHYLEEKGWGERTYNYHLRDWLISRQRYWGPPIPMIYCHTCAKEGRSWFSNPRHHEGELASEGSDGSLRSSTQNYTHDLSHGNSSVTSFHLNEEDKKGKWQMENEKILHEFQDDWDHAGWWPEENLPIELPHLKDFKPQGDGKGPLADHPEFYEVKCPVCGEEARRETDVSDTFLDSSWYFLAYPMQNTKEWEKDSLSDKGAALLQNKIIDSWLPVDLYFGGAEHAVLHLMYARFVTMVLNDKEYIDFDEPFPKFFAHGLMIKDGAKMSKSKGNVVNPDEYIEKFGADTLRLYLMFMGPMDGYPDFRDTGIEGMRRFVDRVWDLYANYHNMVIEDEEVTLSIHIKTHQTIKKVTEDIKEFKYNTAIAAMMELVNLLRDQTLSSANQKGSKREFKCAEWQHALESLALMLAPFAPHMTEEIWNETIGNDFSIHNHPWPIYNKEAVKEEYVEIIVQVNGKTRATIAVNREKSMQEDVIVELAKTNQKVSKWIEGEQVSNTVFIPEKLVNFVLK